MDADKDTNYKHADITHAIIHAAYDVHSELGYGFLEKVYENALFLRLQELDIGVLQQCPIPVRFHQHIVGEYFADLIVEEKIVVELKAVRQLQSMHEVQLVNYLKATKIEVGLLINFGHKVEVKRRIWTK